MDIYKQLETEVLLRNNSPISDFENLSPNNFYNILYNTYSENSPVTFQKSIANDVLDKISIFRIAEDCVKIIEKETFIKLTALGALPRKVVIELYNKKYILDDFIERGITKLWKEQDCIAIMNTRMVLDIAGITKKTHGKLALTKKGTSFLDAANRQEFFKLFISTFADKFNWGYNDRYSAKIVGQFGWTFTIYILNKYGKDYRSVNFYSEKYLKSLPHFLKEFEDEGLMTQLDRFQRCYSIRSFDRFLEWFGIVEFEGDTKYRWNEANNIRATAILEKIFKIDT